MEGPKLVAEAQRSDLTVQEVFIASDTEADTVMERARTNGSEVHVVAEEVLRSVLDTVNPQPVAAVVSKPLWAINDLVASGSILVGVELQDPGNVGAVLRSAEAAGCSGVVLCTPTVDWLNPKAVRASAGSALRLPVLTMAFDEALACFRSQGRQVVATAPSAPCSYDEVELGQAAILVGNEPRGLSDGVLTAADRVVSIPMAGSAESLNVAAAAAVLAFESQRQRRHG